MTAVLSEAADPTATAYAGAAHAGAADRPAHHSSHVGLLHHPDRPQTRTSVDAIIVPNARPPAYLGDALLLGRRLACPVLALCSNWAFADKAHRKARALGAHLIASDIPAVVHLPTFRTSTLLDDTRFARRSDISLKRNIGLAVARMVGWQRVVLLDDDITDIDPDDIGAAATLLSSYAMVAMNNVGFPDNSVVCHALRRLGMEQDSFVGGGAMVVPAHRTTSFFPNVYNEDWFFLLDDKQLNITAVTGEVAQKAFDPYANPGRARAQEFGDCLAEGVFALLDDGRCVQDADHAFWRGFLDDRRQLISRILAAIPDLRVSVPERNRMIAAMKAAQGRRQFIAPKLCVDYLEAWSEDRKVWDRYLNDLPQGLTPRKALGHLGLTSVQIALHRDRSRGTSPSSSTGA